MANVTGPSLFKGVLKVKKGGIVPRFEDRFVVLGDTTVAIYKNENSSKPLKTVDLYHRSVWSAGEEIKKKYSFQLYHPAQKSVVFVASSEAEQMAWMEAIDAKMKPIREELGGDNPYTSSDGEGGKAKLWGGPKTVEAVKEAVIQKQAAADAIGAIPADKPSAWKSLENDPDAFHSSDDGEDWKTVRKHRIAEIFLNKVLGFGWDEVHTYANKFVKDMDEKVEDRMFESAGRPLRCPHGSPIPSKDGMVPVFKDIPLYKSPIDKPAVLRQLDEDGPKFLSKVTAAGLNLGSILRRHGDNCFEVYQNGSGWRKLELEADDVDALLVQPFTNALSA